MYTEYSYIGIVDGEPMEFVSVSKFYLKVNMTSGGKLNERNLCKIYCPCIQRGY